MNVTPINATTVEKLKTSNQERITALAMQGLTFAPNIPIELMLQALVDHIVGDDEAAQAQINMTFHTYMEAEITNAEQKLRQAKLLQGTGQTVQGLEEHEAQPLPSGLLVPGQ